MTPKALSAEFLESELEDIGRFDPRRRDALRAHIAALEADNAALLELVRTASGERGQSASCWACAYPKSSHHQGCRFGEATTAAHPGAALLERHEKAIATLTLAMDVSAAMHESAQRARLEEQAEHAKALVRARNEGREQARRLVNAYAAFEIARGRDHVGVDALADEIDALKESEQ